MFSGKFCIIRTQCAGVHFGKVVQVDNADRVVVLEKGQRIWKWEGANTLHEIASSGVDGPKISDKAPAPYAIFQVTEIIPMTPEAYNRTSKAGWQ